MKKLILGIIIGIILSTGTLALASTTVKLVMVPEYIKGYKTTDLLEYIADQKLMKDIQNTRVEYPINKKIICCSA